MEIKKSSKANLENNSGLFFKVGFILSLILFVFILSECSISNEQPKSDGQIADDSIPELKTVQSVRQLRVKNRIQPQAIQSDSLSINDGVVVEDTLSEQSPNTLQTDTITEKKILVASSEIVVEDEQANDAPIFYVVEQMPEFPGGSTALTRYLSSVRYPASAIEEGMEGRVYISFVVNVKGLIEQAKVVKGVDPILDKAALNQVINMPAWTPGMHRGKPVKVSYTVPINFVLQKQ